AAAAAAASAFLPSFPSTPRTKIAISDGSSIRTTFVDESETESIERTRSINVSVVSLFAIDGLLKGEIYVRNLAYEKKVVIRYTVDGWSTYSEIEAAFSRNVEEDIDAFDFSLTFPIEDVSGCELCVSYSVNDSVFWDNNEDTNYRLEYDENEKKK
ncbi:hypothetical protein PENTCL1PPCAC_7744, partial [Pristionchus entomophagus]